MKTGTLRIYSLLFACLALACISCRKSVDHMPAEVTSSISEVTGFRISESKVVLLKGNADRKAIAFDWAAGKPGDEYALEADVSEDRFEAPIEIAAGTANQVSFTVEAFNTQMCKLLYAENSGKVDFRVRRTRAGKITYSSVTAVNISTYRNYTVYDDDQVIKVPGNYQGWVVATAPRIVSMKQEGRYEGYLDLENPSPQVLLVKGDATQWGPVNTYTYIGNDMFGFGGTIMYIQGGSGVYLFKANTNTNKWSATRINTWNISGDAVTLSSASVMSREEEGLAWKITTYLVKGGFRIKANNTPDISFGQKPGDQPGVPSYDGGDIEIKTPGTYTITLKLSNAGNYAYTIRRN